jgi:hypothetical protein
MKKLLTLLLLSTLALSANSQLEVQIGASKTELRNNAITIGLTYLKSFDSLFGNQEHFIPGKKSFLVITPQLDIKTGTEDAFSSIIVKATGLISTFKTTEVGGLITPDFNKTFHVFPISIGAETNNLFNNINGIVEVGWLPYYQSYGRTSPDWLKKTNIAFFLQGGYKFKAAGVPAPPVGGEVDESEEQPANSILRAKGSAAINTGKLLQVNGLNIGLYAGADVWYDILNTAVYHKLDARTRFFLSDTQFLDFVYSVGSGAPLFNNSQQFGVGISLIF